MPANLVRSCLAVAVVVGLTTGCRSPVDSEGAVTAAIIGSSLRIENTTRSRIFYAAVEGGLAARITLLPCVGIAPECPSVPPDSVVTIPLSAVYGFDSTSEVVHISWWRRLPGPTVSTYRAGTVQYIHLRRST